jgi:polyhydroxybutyrate depolymerase
MKNLITFIICFPILIQAQQTINGSITYGGLQREYILYVPAIYNANNPTPLVFNFHGYTSDAASQMWYGDFRSIADTAGFLIVHPEGTLDNNGTSHWNVGWGGSTVNDIGFTSALIDSLASQYSINLNRVYSTGMSNGGFMSYHLACELSNEIAAVASVTGSMNIGWFNTCNPNHPMPVMEIHGTADPTVTYNTSSFSESMSDIMTFWSNFNSCSSSPVITSVPDINTSDGCTAEHQVWTNGNNGVEVEHYKIINGAHTWPGTAFAFGVTNFDINASVKIWEFFSKYDINGLITPTQIESISNNKPPKLLKIVDILGRTVKPMPNKLLIYIYDDGSIEKKFLGDF